MKKETIQKINNDCPEHGESKEAFDKFWSHPWTSHWGCKCEAAKQKIDTKFE